MQKFKQIKLCCPKCSKVQIAEIDKRYLDSVYTYELKFKCIKCNLTVVVKTNWCEKKIVTIRWDPFDNSADNNIKNKSGIEKMNSYYNSTLLC